MGPSEKLDRDLCCYRFLSCVDVERMERPLDLNVESRRRAAAIRFGR